MSKVTPKEGVGWVGGWGHRDGKKKKKKTSELVHTYTP